MPSMKPRSIQIAERQHEGHVGDDQAGERVHLVVAGEHDVERDDQPGLREHLDRDHEHDEERRVPVKRYFASATAARNASTTEMRDRDEHDDQAVLDVRPEVRPC